MATKYITLEEAAARLKLGVDQLKKLRADGEIRGFADRGTWKFRDTDIDEYARKVQGDSDPDFPAMSDDDFFNTVSGDMGSDSDVRLVSDSGPTSYKITDEDSDSDVQLVDSSMDLKNASKPPVESDDKLKVNDSGAAWAKVSDSDVRIIQSGKSSGKNEISPDSDIQLAESSPAWKVMDPSATKRPGTSDITLKNDPEADSDVKLVQGSAISKLNDSDSDVRIIGDSSKLRKSGAKADSDIKLASDLSSSDSDVKLHPSQSSPAKKAPQNIDLDDDSGLTIELDENSALINQKSSFGKPDANESGISLAGDSGISLELAADSGISLMDEDSNYNQIASDSGISLEPVDESGFTLPPLSDDDIGGTIPMLNLKGDGRDSSDKTIELSNDDDDVFNLASDEDHDTTNVIMFDDDDATTTKKGGQFKGDSALYTDELSEDGEESVFDLSSVDDDMGEEFDADDLELSDDMIGEEEELDVFEADEGDFEDGFESGESQPSIGTGGRQVAYVAADAPWGAGTISLLAVSSIMMLFCTLLMFDVVRSMWSLESPMPTTNMLLELMSSMGL
ncbi:helix-turn-helix domain-containing protein [Lacunimicrobium album]